MTDVMLPSVCWFALGSFALCLYSDWRTRRAIYASERANLARSLMMLRMAEDLGKMPANFAAMMEAAKKKAGTQ